MLRGNGSAGEVSVGRVILKCARISLTRLTGGIDLAGKDICNGDAACLTAETGIEKSLNIFKPRHKNYRAACNYNNGVGVCLGNRSNKLIVLCRNFNSLSVVALALEFFGKTYKYNGYISLRSGLFSLCYKLCTCLSGCLVLLGGSTLIIALSVRNVYAELLKLVKSV